MTTHWSILAWRIPWTEEPGGLHTVHRVAKSWTQLKRLSTHAKRYILSVLHPINASISCYFYKIIIQEQKCSFGESVLGGSWEELGAGGEGDDRG